MTSSSTSISSSASVTSSRNWSYDVFPSFSGKDVRKTFLSHFLKELDRKLIIAFKDNEIERSRSLDPELRQAIKDSRIAVVIFSTNYTSSSWCLNELLEIVKCKEESGQVVIPVFYGLDPSHVRKQTGDFGKIFDKTCQNKTEDEILRWREALTDVANIFGYHNVTWMVDEITNDVLAKMKLFPSNEFESFVGIDDHIRAMSSLLHLESEEVRMAGIWGPSGIGKTTIARVLFTRFSHQFQSSVFIDKVFISKSMEVHRGVNLGDYNMKLHLQRNFLSKVLDNRDINIDHIGAMENMLRHRKSLIFIDDLDDQDVLEALAGSTKWFGSGSRIIVVTKDKHFLRAHGIDHIYEVCFPSEDLALQMFCRSAFRKNSPPDGFKKLASEVVLHAGSLPLGLDVLGSNFRGRDKDDWLDMMPRLQNNLDGKIERTLRVSYDLLNNKKDEAIFRHIACLFNGEEVNDIKLLLADSNLDVNIGLKNLVDKSLIRVCNTVKMHSLLQEMGKEIVSSQSDEPGEREFLIDSKDICDVLEDNTGTKRVLGIALNTGNISELHVHENAFKRMSNLRFLEVVSKNQRHYMPRKLHLSKSFDYLPPKLKLLCWSGYPMRCMPSTFRPENLVKLMMVDSMLERLWEGVVSLTCLKKIDLSRSKNLKEIPDLSKATNLERLRLKFCSSLLEIPSSIRNLKTLWDLNMFSCTNLKTIPTGIYLKSLNCLDLRECSQLRSFPEIPEQNLTQTSIQESPSNLRLEVLDMQQCLTPLLTRLYLSEIPSLVELPYSFQNLNKLKQLDIRDCKNLETLPTCINLQSLEKLDLFGCSRLRSFPNISRNIVMLVLSFTAIEEVPWWIKKFSRLGYLTMKNCNNLGRVSLNILKLKHLEMGDFSNCMALTEASWEEYSLSVVAITTENIHSRLHGVYIVNLSFIGCFNFDHNVLYQQQTVFLRVILSGEEVPSYFTHRSTGISLTNIPLPHISPSQPHLIFKVCALCDVKSLYINGLSFEIQLCFRFVDISGNHFDYVDLQSEFSTSKLGGHLVIFDCCVPLKKVVTPLADQLNYSHIDIQFRLIEEDYALQLKGCGILLLENGQSLGCNPDILPHVFERHTSNNAYMCDHDTTEHSQECGDSALESSADTLSNVCGADQDNVVNDGCHETERSDEFVKSRRNSKRMRIILLLHREYICNRFCHRPKQWFQLLDFKRCPSIYCWRWRSSSNYTSYASFAFSNH
ncbi:hypothetical protein Bca52824_030833 [Brassica carinata]|uniref:ADP-ribosyl cyclase/cyclic ADP-ribose hydrolase n=1 Tax=Brassica carinata TaxID=52824 RepID=A0A8X7S9H6_BRACI|nr:hypothetical protein Bca52824_030833 [Brassica carinata]